jgi:hypothetical protein
MVSFHRDFLSAVAGRRDKATDRGHDVARQDQGSGPQAHGGKEFCVTSTSTLTGLAWPA